MDSEVRKRHDSIASDECARVEQTPSWVIQDKIMGCENNIRLMASASPSPSDGEDSSSDSSDFTPLSHSPSDDVFFMDSNENVIDVCRTEVFGTHCAREVSPTTEHWATGRKEKKPVSLQPPTLAEWKEAYKQDKEISLLKIILQDSNARAGYDSNRLRLPYHNELVKNRLYLDKDGMVFLDEMDRNSSRTSRLQVVPYSLRNRIFVTMLHSLSSSGHSMGAYNLFHRIRQQWYWPNQWKDVNEWWGEYGPNHIAEDRSYSYTPTPAEEETDASTTFDNLEGIGDESSLNSLGSFTDSGSRRSATKADAKVEKGAKIEEEATMESPSEPLEDVDFNDSDPGDIPMVRGSRKLPPLPEERHDENQSQSKDSEPNDEAALTSLADTSKEQPTPPPVNSKTATKEKTKKKSAFAGLRKTLRMKIGRRKAAGSKKLTSTPSATTADTTITVLENTEERAEEPPTPLDLEANSTKISEAWAPKVASTKQNREISTDTSTPPRATKENSSRKIVSADKVEDIPPQPVTKKNSFSKVFIDLSSEANNKFNDKNNKYEGSTIKAISAPAEETPEGETPEDECSESEGKDNEGGLKEKDKDHAPRDSYFGCSMLGAAFGDLIYFWSVLGQDCQDVCTKSVEEEGVGSN